MHESELNKSLGDSEPALHQGYQSPAGLVSEWVSDVACQPMHYAPGIVHDYRVDINRTSGNQVFRRYHDGTLDVMAAKHVVIEVIEQARNGVQPLTDLQKLILSVIFPGVFNFEDPLVVEKMRAAQMNLSLDECQLVAVKVAQHLAEAMKFIVTTSGTSA
jgi:hypothetical protein